MTDRKLLHIFLQNSTKIHFPTLRQFSFFSCSVDSWLLWFRSTSSASARTSAGKSLNFGAMNQPLNEVPRNEIGFTWSQPQESFLLHKYAQTAEPIVYVGLDSLYALNYWNCVYCFSHSEQRNIIVIIYSVSIVILKLFLCNIIFLDFFSFKNFLLAVFVKTFLTRFIYENCFHD